MPEPSPAAERADRPRRRLLLLILAGAAIPFVGRALWWAHAAEPGPADVEAIREAIRAGAGPDLEDGNAAWQAFLRATETVDRIETERRAEGWTEGFAVSLSSAVMELRIHEDGGPEATPLPGGFDPDAARAVIERFETSGALADLDVLAASPVVTTDPGRLVDDDGIRMDLEMPELMDAIAVARARLHGMRAIAAEAPLGPDATEAMTRAWEHALAVARGAMSEPVLIGALVGLSIDAQAHDALNEVLARRAAAEPDRPRLSAQEARALLGALDRQAFPGTMARHLTIERHYLEAVLSSAYTAGGWHLPAARADLARSWYGPNQHLDGDPPRLLNLLSPLYHRLDRVLDLIDRSFGPLIEAARLAPHERSKAQRDALFGTAAMEEIVSDDAWRYGMLSHTMFGDPGQFVVRWDDAGRRRAARRLLLAIEGFRAEHDRWPGDLDELVPGWLPTVPIDPMTGAPFVFELDGDGEPLLRSVGIDGIDQNGQGDDVVFERLGSGATDDG